MSSKYDKKLKKALAQYEKGNYEDALDICEKILDKDYNNEDALTLEARSLEKLEKINDAIISWKINSEYNNNEEARKKLDQFNNIDEKKLAMSTIFSDTIKNEIKAKLQDEVQKEFSKQLEKRESKDSESESIKETKVTKEAKIEQAPVETTPKNNDNKIIKELKETETFKESKVDNVTKVDFSKKDDTKGKKNTITPTIEENVKNEEPKVISTPNFKNENANSKKSKNKKPLKVIAIAISGVIVLGLAYGVNKHMKTNANENQIAASDNVDKNTDTKTENKDNVTTPEQPKEEIKKPETPTFNVDELNKAIQNKDINELYTILQSTPKDKVPADALDSYNNAITLMQNDGVKELYLSGSKLFENKKYEEALNEFNKAYVYSDNSYLKPHLIYFIGAANENLNKDADAIKYFQEYLTNYKAKPDDKDVMYTPQCLYNLAVIYNKEGKKAEAKKYAQEIEDNYPNSMFYNDVTKNIIYS